MTHYTMYHRDIPQFLQAAADSGPMGRLKGIGMNCGCEYTQFAQFKHLAPYTRFDHSLGAALIVWHFTQDEKQALAALFHDLSTPVFAHVIDFLNGDHMMQESTEDGIAQRILGCSALTALLEALGLGIAQVCDYHRYPIADNPSPALSADRLEYTLGNAINFGILSPGQVKDIYDDLTVATVGGAEALCFHSPDKATVFANAALSCGRIYVSDEDRYAMQRLAELLKQALDRGILDRGDLDTTEAVVIEKLCRSPLQKQWQDFCACSRIHCHDAPSETEYRLQVFAKKRYIDPTVLGLGPVSSLDRDFSDRLQEYLAKSQQLWLSAT